MPTNDVIKNKIRLDKLEHIECGYDLNEFRQTENDINFINMFYDELQKVADFLTENNGVLTCFSYAVFFGGNE